MENYTIDLSPFLPALCVIVGIVIGAKFGTRNENYILKLRPNKRFLNENVEVLFGKIQDEVKRSEAALNEYIVTDDTDAYKRFGLRLQLAETIFDIEAACETIIRKLGFNKEYANLLRMKVNHKNEKADYFEEPMGEIFDMERKRMDKQAFMESHDPNYKKEESN